MTNNDRKPDRAQPGDLDGLSDIPTYHTDDAAQADRSGNPQTDKTTVSDRVRSVYQRAGRTAPQNIAPSTPTAETEKPETSNLYQVNESKSSPYLSSHEPENTTALPAQPAQPVQHIEPVAPVAEPAPVPTAAAYAAYDTDREEVVDGRRGTIDFGLAIIRIVTGGLLILHALQTLFQLGGSAGLNGLKDEYANYAYPELLAYAIPVLELAGGVFLLIGLFTPVAAAIATIATTFNLLHEIDSSDGFSFTSPSAGVQLAGLLCILALGLQFTGPGRISADFSRSWAKRPLASSWILAVVGIAGAVALWWFGAATNPFN